MTPHLRIGADTVSLIRDAQQDDAWFALLDVLDGLEGVTRVSLLENSIVLEAQAGPGAALAAMAGTHLGRLDAAYQWQPGLVLTGPTGRPLPRVGRPGPLRQ